MKLVAILRVKDEILIIRECLTKLSELADEIIILDNGSTDGTLECFPEFPKIIKILKTEGYHDGRDRCWLLEEAKKRNPDWILLIDGDEVFENLFTRQVVEKYMQSRYNQISFKLCHFWLGKTHCRIDGPFFAYSMGVQRSMWRNLAGTYFSSKKMHPGNIRGITGKTLISPYRVKHYGYLNKEKMVKKYQTYLKEDDGCEGRKYTPLDPEAKILKYRFREFQNRHFNLLYISAYKYLTNLLNCLVILKRKIIS